MRTPSKFQRRSAVGAVFVALLVAACSTSEPTRFYTLSGFTESTVVVEAATKETVIGVGPITLPRYLDRPQIVSREGPYRLILAEFDSWGEPLEELVPRVLARNLTVLLATEHILVLPRRRQANVDKRIEIEFTRFDFDPEQGAVLMARWEIFQSGSDTPSAVDTVTIREAITTRDDLEADKLDYEAAVAAMSATLSTLSRQIAAAI